MKVSIRIIPLEIVKTYSGTAQSTGNAYKIDTWKVRCPSTNNEIVVTAFGEISDYLNTKRNLEVDGELLIKAKPYNNNWYNELSFVNPIRDKEDESGDLPTQSSIGQQAQQQVNPSPGTGVNVKEDEDDGLPF